MLLSLVFRPAQDLWKPFSLLLITSEFTMVPEHPGFRGLRVMQHFQYQLYGSEGWASFDLWHAVKGFKLPYQCVEHPLFTAYACYGYMVLKSLTATQPLCGFCSPMLGEVIIGSDLILARLNVYKDPLNGIWGQEVDIHLYMRGFFVLRFPTSRELFWGSCYKDNCVCRSLYWGALCMDSLNPKPLNPKPLNP